MRPPQMRLFLSKPTSTHFPKRLFSNIVLYTTTEHKKEIQRKNQEFEKRNQELATSENRVKQKENGRRGEQSEGKLQ